MGVWCVCVGFMCTCKQYLWKQKRASDALELESQAVVNHLI